MQLTAEKRRDLKLFTKYRKQIIAAREAYWSGESNGYCPHGVYVGGCGIDWMCGQCESDDLEVTEEAMYAVKEKLRRERASALKSAADEVLDTALKHGEWLSKEDHKLFIGLYVELRALAKGR